MSTGHPWYDGVARRVVAVHVTRHDLPVVINGLTGGIGQLSAHPQTVGQTTGRTQILSTGYVISINNLSEAVLLICRITLCHFCEKCLVNYELFSPIEVSKCHTNHPMGGSVFTARNEVGVRLCFYTCM